MAQALQRKEKEKAKKVQSESSEKEDKIGNTEIKEEITSTAAKDEHHGEQQPSSEFSPEPFNPPVLPPRPHGGYSTATFTQYTSPPRKMATPSKKLEQAAKRTKDIRNFFGSKCKIIWIV